MKDTNFDIVVRVSLRESGEIKTHREVRPAEGVSLDDLPSGGLVQITQALIVEALRAESYVMLLSKLSLGDKFEEITPSDLDAMTRSQVLKVLDALGPLIADETLRRVC